MLDAVSIGAFEAAQKKEYQGLEVLLSGMWGY